jgi:hypothetical protein
MDETIEKEDELKEIFEEELECKLCFKILYEPITLNCCGNSFCRYLFFKTKEIV